MHNVNLNMSYLCGAQLQDAELPPSLEDTVFMRQIPVALSYPELYYAAKYTDICIYCANAVPSWNDSEKFYPQSEDCSKVCKPQIENEKMKGKNCFLVCVCIHDFSMTFMVKFIIIHVTNTPPSRILFRRKGGRETKV